jgi:hypothetical protein
MNNIDDLAAIMNRNMYNNTMRASQTSIEQNQKNADFTIELMKYELARAMKNKTRADMDSILSDVMTSLKKTGDQIRQSG